MQPKLQKPKVPSPTSPQPSGRRFNAVGPVFNFKLNITQNQKTKLAKSKRRNSFSSHRSLGEKARDAGTPQGANFKVVIRIRPPLKREL